MTNRLPNSGGLPLKGHETDLRAALATVRGPRRRALGVAGYEGFALDDALAHSDRRKHLSFFRQARAVAAVAREATGGQAPTVLESGCGGGDMEPFLRACGVPSYLGVDVNPIAFEHSPHIRPRPAHFRLLNLQEEIDFGFRFTVVCSFEVLEHIREEHLDKLLATIRNHMSPSSVFLGTASLQDELDVHVTVRPRTFWEAAFLRHGLRHPTTPSSRRSSRVTTPSTGTRATPTSSRSSVADALSAVLCGSASSRQHWLGLTGSSWFAARAICLCPGV